jgi:sugar lactone lactonase YvrE
LTELRVPGLKFPEGPRWRDGSWWLSDQLGGRVLRVDEHGELETVVHAEAPSGLGFLPDGALLVARMNDPSLVRVDGATAEEVSDLRPMARHLNDMYVAPDGRAYVDAYDDHFDSTSHRVVMVPPDEERSGRGGTRLSQWHRGHAGRNDHARVRDVRRTDHRLRHRRRRPWRRRVWAPLPEGTHPDGLCLDEAGDVWVASYLNGEFLHVLRTATSSSALVYDDRWAMSCCLGGDDGRSLLLCTAETSQDDYFAGRSVRSSRRGASTSRGCNVHERQDRRVSVLEAPVTSWIEEIADARVTEAKQVAGGGRTGFTIDLEARDGTTTALFLPRRPRRRRFVHGLRARRRSTAHSNRSASDRTSGASTRTSTSSSSTGRKGRSGSDHP